MQRASKRYAYRMAKVTHNHVINEGYYEGFGVFGDKEFEIGKGSQKVCMVS